MCVCVCVCVCEYIVYIKTLLEWEIEREEKTWRVW